MEILTLLGPESGALAFEIAALVYGYRLLVGRVDKLEGMVDAKLNNGIRSKLEDLQQSVARIEGRCQHCDANAKNLKP